MEIYLTSNGPATAAVKFRLPSLVSLAGPARIAEPTAARTPQMIGQISWPSAGLMPVSNQAAPQHQDGRFADFGGCDVTDTKFSTRLGPPSCSPPV
ncbi:MAG TPA: hypothetical protein VK401_08755 [Propionibacteriaceae bacterium]|jgi:hypothetical protein|nr:hypothetical protein [Propionibacteriaceae bacterium]